MFVCLFVCLFLVIYSTPHPSEEAVTNERTSILSFLLKSHSFSFYRERHNVLRKINQTLGFFSLIFFTESASFYVNPARILKKVQLFSYGIRTSCSYQFSLHNFKIARYTRTALEKHRDCDGGHATNTVVFYYIQRV